MVVCMLKKCWSMGYVSLLNFSFILMHQNLGKLYLYPTWTKFRGYIEITMSVCLFVWLCADSCLVRNIFLLWYWHTIFGTWVYHHEKICVVFIYDPDTTLTYDLKVKFIGFLTCLFVGPCFDIGLSYLALWWTMRWWVTYIRNPNTKFTFDLKVKFIWFLTLLCVQATSFLSFDIVIRHLAQECITIRHMSHTFMTSVWPWPLAFILKFYIFTMNLCLGKIVFALLHRHTKYGTYGFITMRQHVYIHDLYMTLSFDLLSNHLWAMGTSCFRSLKTISSMTKK